MPVQLPAGRGFLLVGGKLSPSSRSDVVYKLSNELEWSEVARLTEAKSHAVAIPLFGDFSTTAGVGGSLAKVRKTNPNTEGINIRWWQRPRAKTGR